MALEALSVEIDKIVNSPWLSQLKTLHDICKTCTPRDIHCWTASKPCQVSSLARIVLLEARHHPYITNLIAILCQAIDLRDAFLQHDPTLVHRLFKSQDQEPIIAVLSHPLPRHVALPTEAQSFFLNMLDNVASSPNDESVKTFYMAMTGGFQPLMSLLSTQTLDKIERRLLSIIRARRSADDNRSTLYALSTILSIIQATQLTDNLLRESSPQPLTWVPEQLRAYFDDRKAARSLTFLATTAIWACHAGLSDGQELLVLSNALVRKIPEALRQEWIKKNLPVVAKLEQKIMQKDLKDDTRLSTMLFLCHVHSPAMPSEEVRKLLSSQIRKPVRLAELASTATEEDLQVLVSVMEPSVMTAYVQSLPELILQGKLGPASAIGLARLTDTLTGLVEDDRIPANTITAALIDEAALPSYQSMLSLVKTSSGSTNDLNDGICAMEMAKKRNGLIVALCALHLKSSLNRHRTVFARPQILSTILELFAFCQRSSPHCCHSQQQQLSHDSVQVLSTTDSVQLGNWQEALSAYLQQRSITERECLEFLFRSRCQDLERRCETVEQPLREQETRYQCLQQQYDELSASHIAISEKAAQLEQRLHQMHGEHVAVSDELKMVLAENDDLTAKLGDTIEQAQLRAIGHEEQIQELDKAHEAALIQRAFELANRQEQLDDTRDKLTFEQSEHQTCQRSKEEAEHMVSRLEGELKDARRQLSEQQAALVHLTKELDGSKDTTTSLTETVNVLKMRLETEASSHAQELLAMQQRINDKIQSALDAASTEHETRYAGAQAKHNTDIHSLQTQLAAAHAAQKQASDEISQLLEVIRHCTAKNERLASSCLRKDQQLSNFYKERKNMLAAMNLGPPEAYQQERSDDTTVTSLSDADHLMEQAPYGQANFAAGHRTSASLAISKASANILHRAMSDVLPNNISPSRRPLLPVSVNISPSKSSRKMSRQSVHKIMEEDVNEVIFDGEDLTRSTPDLND